MLMIERFYCDFEEAVSTITAGSNGTDYYISFLSGEEDGGGLDIQIKIRGKENFRDLIKLIHDFGDTIVR